MFGWQITYLSKPLQNAVVYIWCKKVPDIQLNVFFFFRIRATFLPWFMLILQIVFKGEVLHAIFGIIAGHFYYFFADVLPKAPNFASVKLLTTPHWLYALSCRVASSL
eukprot:TRINITY_DN8053_c0_g1_i11.p1 TRINITY_DN8053_c0_g1~~TRINITY_DN8053_c0_g1_i11.p1  ORF type:complete len:108 (-),score=5.33 TRINITY_DN8053_c0_g1_i11:249-572(-)